MTKEDSYKARYRFKKDGKRHLLIFSEVTLEDAGRFQVITNGGQCEADLIVEGTGLPMGRGPLGTCLSSLLQAAQAPNFGFVSGASLCLTPVRCTSEFSEESLTPPGSPSTHARTTAAVP